VDQALCFGWIDGVRKSIDESRYKTRFSPRKAGSRWSNVNIRRIEGLQALGLMHPAGLAAFEARGGSANGPYEQPGEVVLPEEYEKRLRANKRAWAWFSKSRPSYRKSAIWWVITAKQEVTRERRLKQLIDCSEQGVFVPPYIFSRGV
jgi:uncharacterized protein YdeI (YjbR/CyaY-like superfamily)